MNLNDDPTRDQLRELLAGGDDLAGHHVLWVATNGDVRLTRVPATQWPGRVRDVSPDTQLRYETFEVGKEYVGPDAAADARYVDEVFDNLLRAWDRVKGTSRTEYIEVC